MELERMHHQSQATNGVPRARRVGSANGMEHLNLSLPLHVQVPPLPSPNTTAAAAALFRVNQLPPGASTPDANYSNTSSAFSFKSPSSIALKKRQRLLDAHGHALGIYAPPGTPTAPSQPTPTTAAAAAAAMALSASSPASAASVQQYEQNKRAMLLAASNAMSVSNKTNNTNNINTNNSLPTPDGQEMRRRKVGIPKFLRYLFQMLEYEDHAVIAWSHEGAAFQIRDPDELAERVLPKYFKHNKVSSFQRQLNYFGFKKWTKTQTNICTFSHPCFHRDEQDKMRLIKRKERSTRGVGGANKSNKTNKMNHANADDQDEDEDEHDHDHAEDDDEDESDEYHAAAKAPPAKRAKLTNAKQTSLPQQAKRLASLASGGESTPTRGRGRPPTLATEKGKKQSKPKASKPPRGNKKRHDLESESNANEPRRKMPLPMISPASASSPSSSSSTTTISRLVPHSASPSPTHAVYGRTSSSSDAAPVMPVHSEMLLQQQHSQHQQQSNPFLRRFPYDSGGGMGANQAQASLQDLSEAFGNGGGSGNGNGGGGWGSQSQGDSYGLGAYKFPDPSDFGYGNSGATNVGSTNGSSGNGSGGGGHSSNPHSGLPNAKDYLDVLLESANMDDPQLSTQSASAAWETPYQQSQQSQHQQHQHQGYGRGEEAAMATFSMLGVPPHQAHAQLPSIEDLQGTGRY